MAGPALLAALPRGSLVGSMIDPDAGWEALEAAFAALGRVLLLLDAEFRVVRATMTLDTWVCQGACRKIRGRSIEDLLGAHLFGADEALRASLEHGAREEGRRAFVQCETGAARLASVTVAPVLPGSGGWADGARYLLVLRPAEEDQLILEGALAAQGLVARAPAMLKIVRFIESLHRSDATVLITGESGTGKEVVARALHASSPRRAGPFVAVNCGALPPDLLESELFGHVRGAFTGAVRDRVGRFEAARDGVVFLDEIGDMPPVLQVKLLRVLQARTFERVGESTPRTVDARVIAATNVDLKDAIATGRFREDLYYRLRVVPIHVPPLREREEDVEPLARHLLSRIGAREGRAVRFSPEVLLALKRHPWPGNVRELENAIEYAVAICQRQTVQLEDLPPEVADGSLESPPSAEPDPGEVGSDEAARVRAALDAHRWHHARAAAELGISRTTLWRKMRSLGLT
ncbi:MAG: sigma 54-interacting transcriptional regulator [Myxococcales bacterium]|nr:sigma 54-interacting transcriptional regulator [Myxococcales bacterium]